MSEDGIDLIIGFLVIWLLVGTIPFMIVLDSKWRMPKFTDVTLSQIFLLFFASSWFIGLAPFVALVRFGQLFGDIKPFKFLGRKNARR